MQEARKRERSLSEGSKMLVKITILVVVITIIYRFFISVYLKNNPIELYMLKTKDYTPAYTTIFGWLIITSIILILASTVYLLFF